MGSGRASRIVVLGFDAGNPQLVRTLASQGLMPNAARVIEHSRSAVVRNEPGVFVGSVWPTLLSGTGVAEHGFYTGIRPAPFEYHYVPEPARRDPFWVAVSRAGRRVMVIDPPLFPARHDIDAVQIVEWGAHDRYHGSRSVPTDLLDDVVRVVGRHPIGMLDHELERFAPCDWVERQGPGPRSGEEVLRFIGILENSIEQRARLSKYARERFDVDLLIDIIGESHCVGHQLWHLHDPSHVSYDPALVEEVGCDPLIEAYSRLDEIVGSHLDALSDEDVFFFLLSHGMQPHYDGTAVLDDVLWRLEHVYLGRPLPPDRTVPSDPGARLWYQLENNTVTGAVRFNLAGREPRGCIGDDLASDASDFLTRELRALVNADTGEPAVTAVYPSSILYQRRPADGLPDLFVEWDRSQPVERVVSSAVGEIRRPYVGHRTGDHMPDGELYVMSSAVHPGSRPEIAAVDVAPTIAAAAGVRLGHVDGRIIHDLLGASALGSDTDTDTSRSELRPEPTSASADLEIARLRAEVVELRRLLGGLQAAHHETREGLLRATGRDELSTG